MTLPPRQSAVLDFIRAEIGRGLPPSLAEIGRQFGISVEGAAKHVMALQKKGAIRREAGRCRSIALAAST